MTYDYFPHALRYVHQRCNRCVVQLVIGGDTVEVDCNFRLIDQQFSGGRVTAGYEITGTRLIDSGGTLTEIRYALANDSGICISASYETNLDVPNYTRLHVNISASYTATTAS